MFDTMNATAKISMQCPLTLSDTYFEKVPFEQFAKDFGIGDDAPDDAVARLHDAWEAIPLPLRSTSESAGYDFFLPYNVCLDCKKETVIPTGIRVKMQPGWFLMCVPRSGLGFKYGTRLRNSTGIIDADYYNADNYGHIMASVTTEIPVALHAGDRFMQGIFVPFGITENDMPIRRQRTGGFGSTGGVT